jgi:hypothetical protein
VRTLLERFEAKVQRTDGCWLWTAKLNNRGYGLFNINKKMVAAHRVSYELYVGPIPEGHDIDHVKSRGCTARHCVNPDHLEPVTHRENLLRGSGFAAVNAAKTHCPRGHEYSPENTYVNPHPQGGRICRICKREGDRRRASARRFLTVHEPAVVAS